MEFVKKLIYSLSPISWESFKPLAHTFWEILLTSLKCPNLQRAITLKKCEGICSKLNQVNYTSSSISWPSFKSLAQIVFEISWSLKCPNLQRAITPEKIDGIRSKLNQVNHSLSSISWPSFKLLAQILFKISCWQDFILIFSKGHNSRKGHNSDKKKIWVRYFFMRNPYMKFQNHSMHGS